MFKDKFMALNSWTGSYKMSKIKNLCFYLNKTEKEQVKLNVNRRNNKDRGRNQWNWE